MSDSTLTPTYAGGKHSDPEIYPRNDGTVYICGEGEQVKLPADPLAIESTAAARDNLMASPGCVIRSNKHPCCGPAGPAAPVLLHVIVWRCFNLVKLYYTYWRQGKLCPCSKLQAHWRPARLAAVQTGHAVIRAIIYQVPSTIPLSARHQVCTAPAGSWGGGVLAHSCRHSGGQPGVLPAPVPGWRPSDRRGPQHLGRLHRIRWATRQST